MMLAAWRLEAGSTDVAIYNKTICSRKSFKLEMRNM